jgi:hypothetical protein
MTQTNGMETSYLSAINIGQHSYMEAIVNNSSAKTVLKLQVLLDSDKGDKTVIT